MLTYDLMNCRGPMYQALYEHIREDIRSGKLKAGEKMPSKRSLAQNLGISTITIENAYDQLIGEGYLYSLPKRGYFVSNFGSGELYRGKAPAISTICLPEPEPEPVYDFSSNRTDSSYFPFSIWTKIMREIFSEKEKELMEVSPCGGIRELREAIADHLNSFRGMRVDPNRIIVGAGTEYLYGLLVKLLGTDRIYCVENPGYQKPRQIYESNGARCRFAGMDEQGIEVSELERQRADIAHVSPNHHFPTGITMPIGRRMELLGWAEKFENRYIIEDDYDSEFRMNGKPLPTLQSLDPAEKVIYMNTFSKSLSSTIRISYMVLPPHLISRFYRELSFYSCTVSTFEQYALAAFISRGYFEKHINRMRLHYGRKRKRVLEVLREELNAEQCEIIENDSGLHFLLRLHSRTAEGELRRRLQEKKIRIAAVSDYDQADQEKNHHYFLLNYSGLDEERFPEALRILRKAAEIDDPL